MPITWHPTRWWNWCLPEDEKKEIKLFFKKHGIVATKIKTLISYQLLNGAVG